MQPNFAKRFSRSPHFLRYMIKIRLEKEDGTPGA